MPQPSQGSFSLLLLPSVQVSPGKPKVWRRCTKTFVVFFFFQPLSCGSKKPVNICSETCDSPFWLCFTTAEHQKGGFYFFFPWLLIFRRIFHFVTELFSHSAMSSGGEELCSQIDEMKMLPSLHCIKQALWLHLLQFLSGFNGKLYIDGMPD